MLQPLVLPYRRQWVGALMDGLQMSYKGQYTLYIHSIGLARLVHEWSGGIRVLYDPYYLSDSDVKLPSGGIQQHGSSNKMSMAKFPIIVG
jgi:hypothetical protein